MIKYDTYWDEEKGLAVAKVIDTTHDEVFIGTAICSEEDSDMKSQLTGQEIAYRRAYIEYLKYLKHYYKIQYKTLRDFQKNVENCKYYNPEFQIESLLSKNVRQLKNTLATVTAHVKVEQKSLQAYIEAKAKIYQKIREGRKNKK